MYLEQLGSDFQRTLGGTLEFHESVRERVRDLFEAQVANFRVLDLLLLHDEVVQQVATTVREQLDHLNLDDEAKTRIARQIAQTFVQPSTAGVGDDEGELEERANAKAEELAGLAMQNMEERDFTGLTIRRDLSARSRESMLVTLWSDFEAFIAELFALLAARQPGPLVPHSKTVELREVLAHGTIEALTHHLVQKKIDSVFREAFPVWMDELCGSYGLAPPAIPDSLRESYFRRNLVVHAGATVNSTYLASVSSLDVDKPSKGDRLSVDRDYLLAVADQLAALAFALAIGAAGKHDREHLANAEGDFGNLCYILLIERRPGAVFQLGEMFRHGRFQSQSSREIMKVNFWLSCRDLNVVDDYREEIEAWDTSALEEIYGVAKQILLGNHEVAQAQVNEMRESGRLQERFWKTWPLFRDLRAAERNGLANTGVDTEVSSRANLDSHGDRQGADEGAN